MGDGEGGLNRYQIVGQCLDPLANGWTEINGIYVKEK